MKKIIFTIAAVVCIALTSSCKKETIDSYTINVSGINCPTAKSSVSTAFTEECNQIAKSFTGTSSSQDQFVAAIGVVVEKYNHKYLDGKVKAFKSGVEIKTFQLLMTVGYDISGLIVTEGKENELTKFSNAVQAVVDKYHNNEYNDVSNCLDEIKNVVTNYNYKDLQGTFKVWFGDSSTIVKEHTMHFAL